jgi:regulator of ribosome biosynthesis
LFAKKKGIQKVKTPNTVYDEETGEWVPKWGYKGANKKNENEWLVELPSERPDQEDENPRTALKKDRKARVSANEGRRVRNSGEEIPVKKKSAVAKEVITKKLAQRLRKVRVGKTLGGRTGRRK